MAFSLTTAQVRAGTKTVTRRMGWADLEVGEEFCAIVKGQGIPKGGKVERMAILRCISNRPEPLTELLRDREYGIAECRREGFPLMTPDKFVVFFCRSHKDCTSESSPNRIEFEYVRFLP